MCDSLFWQEHGDSVVYIPTDSILGAEELRLQIGKRLGAGCQREVFESNLQYKGSLAVLKRARNPQDAKTNLFEAAAYAYAVAHDSDLLQHLPHIIGVSVSGAWLLMEQCIPARQAHDSCFSELPFDKIHASLRPDVLWDKAHAMFPECLHDDLHCGNWGYTISDHRPVVFDMGHREDGISQFSNGLGLQYNEETCLFEKRSTAQETGCQEKITPPDVFLMKHPWEEIAKEVFKDAA